MVWALMRQRRGGLFLRTARAYGHRRGYKKGINHAVNPLIYLVKLVGTRGFEPPTPDTP